MAEIKMNDELRAKLAGALPMRTGSSIDYVPEMYDLLDLDYDTKAYISPVIQLRPWTNKEVMLVRDQQNKESYEQGKLQADKEYNNSLTEVNKIRAEQHKVAFKPKKINTKTIDRKSILLGFCKCAILGIDNFRDIELEEIEFNETNLNKLPEAAIMNIFDKLSDISGMTQATYTQVEQSMKAQKAARKMISGNLVEPKED